MLVPAARTIGSEIRIPAYVGVGVVLLLIWFIGFYAYYMAREPIRARDKSALLTGNNYNNIMLVAPFFMVIALVLMWGVRRGEAKPGDSERERVLLMRPSQSESAL